MPLQSAGQVFPKPWNMPEHVNTNPLQMKLHEITRRNSVPTSMTVGSVEKAPINAAGAIPEGPSPHPLMHRHQTVDYGLVLEGELVLVLDGSETPLRTGDVVIQRGTSHAWANRSGRPARMAFILIDGAYEGDLKPG